MSFSKSVLRNMAKRAYKEQTKSVPKKKRISFQQFYKQYVKLHSTVSTPSDNVVVEEDFDVNTLVNVNSVDSDSLVTGSYTENDSTEV